MMIAGVASAFPPHCYDQHTISDALRGYWGDKLQRPELLTRLHSRTGVEYRNFAFPLNHYARFETGANPTPPGWKSPSSWARRRLTVPWSGPAWRVATSMHSSSSRLPAWQVLPSTRG